MGALVVQPSGLGVMRCSLVCSMPCGHAELSATRLAVQCGLHGAVHGGGWKPRIGGEGGRNGSSGEGEGKAAGQKHQGEVPGS